MYERYGDDSRSSDIITRGKRRKSIERAIARAKQRIMQINHREFGREQVSKRFQK